MFFMRPLMQQDSPCYCLIMIRDVTMMNGPRRAGERLEISAVEVKWMKVLGFLYVRARQLIMLLHSL